MSTLSSCGGVRLIEGVVHVCTGDEVGPTEVHEHFWTQLDLKRVEFASPDEIVEENVADIEFAAGQGHPNRKWHPYAGRVKWFRDELGQLWVKFYMHYEGANSYTCHVYPAASVVEVVYLSKRKDPFA